jgi:hypothetical protein
MKLSILPKSVLKTRTIFSRSFYDFLRFEGCVVGRGLQRDVVYLWLTNSTLVIRVQMRGERGVAAGGLSQ